MNRRHMISDHHGRVTDIATSLLTATDGIIGTHTASAATRPRAARDGRTTTGCRQAAGHALFAQSRFGVIGGRG